MAVGGTSRRGLKICCGITAVFLVVIAVVVITLAFTIFKPKDPIITLHIEGLQNIELWTHPNASTVKLGMVITIENDNHGSFKYQNTTAYVEYYGDVVGEAPIEERYVPARDKLNTTTSLSLMPFKILSNPHFVSDFQAGSFNLTSSADLHGEVKMLKVFKLDGTVYNRCKISVFVNSLNVESMCEAKLKI